MRTIYHLGLHKTGSTSLQFFLQRNQQQLARAGILFPPVTPMGLSHFRTDGMAGAAPRAPDLNDYMGHNALAYRMISEAVPDFIFPPVHDPMPDADSALTQIKAQAQELDTRTLVFCSEDLARASLMVPKVPDRFARIFGTRDVTLMATLRRPDTAIAAWQTQRLRFGTPFAPLHSALPEAWLGTVHFEYRAALEPWLKTFPGAHIHLQPYDQLRAQGGSIASFGALSGIALPPHLDTLPDTNPGLPYALLEISRLSLEALPRLQARAFMRYLEGAAHRLDLPANDQIELFAPATRTALHRAFQDIHAWLYQTAGTWPFFADIDAMRTRPPLHILEATQQILPDLLQDARIHIEDAGQLSFLKKISL